jgi:uncharacterized membrane protein
MANGPSTLYTGRSAKNQKHRNKKTTMKTINNAVVAIYQSHAEAEAAIKELQQSGFDMKKLSIVGRDHHTDEHVVGYYNTGERMKYWGKLGAVWGGIWGLLFGSAFFFIPGIGPLLVAGPLVTWILGALESAVVVGGVSAIGAGLCGLGVPKNSVLQYETAIKTGKFVLIAHGTAEEATRAREIISRTNPEALTEHELSLAGTEASLVGV